MKQNYSETFRLNMKYYREKRGLNQSELAIQADSSNGNIGNIESGASNPSFEMILRIADALKIHPADLFLRGASESRLATKETIENRLVAEIHRILEGCF